jgi:hypothetical protein
MTRPRHRIGWAVALTGIVLVAQLALPATAAVKRPAPNPPSGPLTVSPHAVFVVVTGNPAYATGVDQNGPEVITWSFKCPVFPLSPKNTYNNITLDQFGHKHGGYTHQSSFAELPVFAPDNSLFTLLWPAQGNPPGPIQDPTHGAALKTAGSIDLAPRVVGNFESFPTPPYYLTFSLLCSHRVALPNGYQPVYGPAMVVPVCVCVSIPGWAAFVEGVVSLSDAVVQGGLQLGEHNFETVTAPPATTTTTVPFTGLPGAARPRRSRRSWDRLLRNPS